MEQLVNDGLVRHIGLSNVGKTLIEQVFSYATVKPTVVQNEMHPFNTKEELFRISKEAGLVSMAYSSLGLLSYAAKYSSDLTSTPEESLVEHESVT